MLACARIGAAHSVVFGGFSRRGAARPHQRRRGQGADHGRRRLSPRPGRAAEAERGRGGGRVPDDRARDHGQADRRGARVRRGPRSVVARRRRRSADRVRGGAHGRRGSAVPALHERHDGQTQGDRAHHRRVPHAGRGDPPHDLRHPRGRRVLVRRGHRMGDGPLLHRLRAAREPHDGDHLRGRAGLAGQGSAVGDRGEVPRDDPLHRADRDPRVHAMGHRVPAAPRPLVAPAPGVGRGADQPRGLGLVLDVHRRRAVPRRRHLVADRNGGDHDHAAPRADAAQARLGDGPVPRRRGRHRR